MNANIGAAGLTSCWQRELMYVCWKMTETVQNCCRAMRNYSIIGSAFPCRYTGRELEPSCAQIDMVRYRRSSEVIHAVDYSFKFAPLDEARDRRWRKTGSRRLAARDQAPLVLSKWSESGEARLACHYYILTLLRDILQ
jgi:hypothetical protein